MKITGNKIDFEDAWKKMLTHIHNEGYEVTKDDSTIVEHLGFHLKIKDPRQRLLGHISAGDFVDWIERGAFDIKEYPIKGEALAEYVDSINSIKQLQAQGFVYTYPERLRMTKTISDDDIHFRIDQIRSIVDRLKNNPGSNRAIAALYVPGIDYKRVDIPCLQILQAFIRDDKLILSVFFRSNDIYGAFPSNMLFISHIGMIIEWEMNKYYEYRKIEFDHIDYHVSSAHYYKTDEDAVNKIIEVKK